MEVVQMRVMFDPSTGLSGAPTLSNSIPDYVELSVGLMIEIVWANEENNLLSTL